MKTAQSTTSYSSSSSSDDTGRAEATARSAVNTDRAFAMSPGGAASPNTPGSITPVIHGRLTPFAGLVAKKQQSHQQLSTNGTAAGTTADVKRLITSESAPPVITSIIPSVSTSAPVVPTVRVAPVPVPAIPSTILSAASPTTSTPLLLATPTRSPPPQLHSTPPPPAAVTPVHTTTPSTNIPSTSSPLALASSQPNITPSPHHYHQQLQVSGGQGSTTNVHIQDVQLGPSSVIVTSATPVPGVTPSVSTASSVPRVSAIAARTVDAAVASILGAIESGMVQPRWRGTTDKPSVTVNGSQSPRDPAAKRNKQKQYDRVTRLLSKKSSSGASDRGPNAHVSPVASSVGSNNHHNNHHRSPAPSSAPLASSVMSPPSGSDSLSSNSPSVHHSSTSAQPQNGTHTHHQTSHGPSVVDSRRERDQLDMHEVRAAQLERDRVARLKHTEEQRRQRRHQEDERRKEAEQRQMEKLARERVRLEDEMIRQREEKDEERRQRQLVRQQQKREEQHRLKKAREVVAKSSSTTATPATAGAPSSTTATGGGGGNNVSTSGGGFSHHQRSSSVGNGSPSTSSSVALPELERRKEALARARNERRPSHSVSSAQ
jgi:hypothetical protein